MKTHATKCGLWAALFLASALAASAASDPVTYQVNMSVQMASGNFVPANGDTVLVSGNWDGWSTTNTLSVSADTNIYTITLNQTVGNWPNYKFVINPYGNSSGSSLKWESIANRFFQVPTGGTNLPVVYFNNITNVAVPYAPVTFQVNMSVQIAQGSFDPLSGTLVVAGGAINNWSTTASPLTQSLTDTNIWVGTFSVTNPVGGSISYAYVMNGTWESIPNRTFVMTNVAQTLPVVYFNNVTNVAVPIPLTFQVNMGVQEAYGNFNPANGDFVEARGSFLVSGGQWIGGWTLSNSPSAPLIYSGTYIDTNDAPGSIIQYKFVINGSTWESGTRYYTITSTNEQILPSAFFNNVNNLGPVANSVSGNQINLSWNAGTHVRLQNGTNLTNAAWVDVPGTEGQSSTNFTIGPGQMYFRLVGP
jgi:hypothetical protein